MKLLEGTMLPSALFSTVSNFLLQVILFITMWTFGMTAGRWVMFALTCHIAQFISYLGILVLNNHLKIKGILKGKE
jgi:hypothetical protein